MQVHRTWAEVLQDTDITARPRNYEFINTCMGTNLYWVTAAQLEKKSLFHPFVNWPSSSILGFLERGIAFDQLHVRVSRHICKNILFEHETCWIWGSHCNEWRGSRFLSSKKRPDRPWGSPYLLSVGIRFRSLRSSGRGLKLTTHICVLPKLRMSGAILCSPICLYVVERGNFTLLQWIITHVCGATPQSIAESFRR